MRIGVDVSCWQDRRGFGRFTRELVSQLVRDHATSHEFVLIADERTARAHTLPASLEVVVARTRPASSGSHDGWRRPRDLVRLGRTAADCGADVFWFPTAASFYPVPGRVPVVLTVHDAMTEERPHLFFADRRSHRFWQAKVWLARRRASALTTPSESARRAVAAAWRWPVETIVAIGEAPAPVFVAAGDAPAAPVLARHGLPVGIPLVLFVGGIDPHKNLATLLRGMALVHPADAQAWHLVLVGEHGTKRGRRCHDELVTLRDELALGGRVTFTGFVPDDDLATLYRAGTALVLPSLDEGFGLPAVEAMACGLPVAVSNRGSLPEVVARAGLTFDPEDDAAIAHAVGRVLDDPDLRRELGARGRARAAEFSWARSARQLLTVLETAGAR